MAIARSVKARLQMSRDELLARPAFQLSGRDYSMMLVLLAAGVLAFGPARWRQRWKLPYQLILIGYVGLMSGDLIAQSLLAGWARNGIPWQNSFGLVLLVAAGLVVPWVSRQPFYCHHICPHGAAQELIGKLRPRRWTLTLRADVIRALQFLPFALLALTLIIALTAVPFELAGIEPFDAYVVRTAGMATLTVAVLGLVASCFVPQAYCRFGCPTGALLNFVRTRGPSDRFSLRDTLAGGLVAIALALNVWYVPVMVWIKGVPA